uniref:V-type proton ATPase proteolipid subunit n=1 Tax=Grammatophora oceanica TaxID=210454 RepID=A0A7S1Y4C9_9STRA
MADYATAVTAGYDDCPDWAPVFGYAGAASCMILANFGSAWGTWRAGLGVCSMGVNYPKGVIKNIVPIVMAGVLGIYGLIVAVIITQAIMPPNGQDQTTTYSVYNGMAHLSAGLCCGLSCLAAGGTIGIIGDVGVRSFGLKASGGRRSWDSDMGEGDGGDVGGEAANAEAANKLYVGLLIMLIFAEALALYGLIVALILSQNSFYCGK